MPNVETLEYFKDAQLDQLARIGNVAQFVSFSPDLQQRFSRIMGFPPNHHFCGVSDALTSLLDRSPEHRVNLRSFKPDSPQGQEFIYGIVSEAVAEQEVIRLAESGLFVIANETVDVNDGGVSGVAHGGVIEFAPGATPRVVESGHIVSLGRKVGDRILDKVYGFSPAIPDEPSLRIEFSIHPVRRGFAADHTIVWELQDIPVSGLQSSPSWPNAFSEFVGDKVFGLLLADAIGLNVPRSTVICRNVAPFTFGASTGGGVKWMRTSPKIPEPGLFPTVRGWTDPFEIMRELDGRERIASIIVQDEVEARASGALLTGSDSKPIIEGVTGFGDDFMLGRVGPTRLDPAIVNRLEKLHSNLLDYVGSVRAEWVFDGVTVWVLQLQKESAVSVGRTIVPGNVYSEVDFEVSAGISGLRELIELVRDRGIGIRVHGNIGITSHVADILRRHRVPSRIIPNA